MTTSDGRLSPPLKWAGGKRWLIPELLPMYQTHRHRRLVEPFCGALAVSLGLEPDRALVNDVNPHLINFFTWLQDGLVISLDMTNDESTYYDRRDEFNMLIKTGDGDSRESAELFYYLNRTGYNGLCRFNSQDEFNVPFGRYKRINYNRDFRGYRNVLENWEFRTGDFEQLPVDSGDFIYADPPYDVDFTNYAQRDFGWDDQVRLALWLARHQGPVVLSNQATGRIVDLYRDLGFDLSYLKGPRMISCTGDRTPAEEVLATRNLD